MLLKLPFVRTIFGVTCKRMFATSFVIANVVSVLSRVLESLRDDCKVYRFQTRLSQHWHLPALPVLVPGGDRERPFDVRFQSASSLFARTSQQTQEGMVYSRTHSVSIRNGKIWPNISREMEKYRSSFRQNTYNRSIKAHAEANFNYPQGNNSRGKKYVKGKKQLKLRVHDKSLRPV